MTHLATSRLGAEVQQAIDLSLECHQAALETIQYCLEQGGRHADPAHILLLEDCAAIAQSAADFMSRGSSWQGKICFLAADVCETCARDCEELSDDRAMRECARICRECAESCRRIGNAR